MKRVCGISYPSKFLRKKDIFLVWPLGAFFLAFQMSLLEFGSYILVLHFSFKFSFWHPYPIDLELIAYVKINHQISVSFLRQRRYEVVDGLSIQSSISHGASSDMILYVSTFQSQTLSYIIYTKLTTASLFHYLAVPNPESYCCGYFLMHLEFLTWTSLPQSLPLGDVTYWYSVTSGNIFPLIPELLGWYHWRRYYFIYQ